MSKYIVIDSDNYAASGIEILFFPGGEPHAKVPEYDKPVLFVARCRTWNDTGFAACVDAVLRQRPWLRPKEAAAGYKLFMPYAPGARQDRHAPRTDMIVSEMFGGYHDSDNRGSVHFFDLHSSASAGYDAGLNWMPSDLNLNFGDNITGIIAPDSGALGRTYNFQDAFAPKATLIECTKVRNPQTGVLSNYSFPEGDYPPGRYIVVDDICDGGGTFNLLAQAWAKRYSHSPDYSLELFVSHGIFSKGLSALSPFYSRIYTTDSWFRRQTFTEHTAKRLEVIPLSPLYDKIMQEYL